MTYEDVTPIVFSLTFSIHNRKSGEAFRRNLISIPKSRGSLHDPRARIIVRENIAVGKALFRHAVGAPLAHARAMAIARAFKNKSTVFFAYLEICSFHLSRPHDQPEAVAGKKKSLLLCRDFQFFNPA